MSLIACQAVLEYVHQSSPPKLSTVGRPWYTFAIGRFAYNYKLGAALVTLRMHKKNENKKERNSHAYMHHGTRRFAPRVEPFAVQLREPGVITSSSSSNLRNWKNGQGTALRAGNVKVRFPFTVHGNQAALRAASLLAQAGHRFAACNVVQPSETWHEPTNQLQRRLMILVWISWV